MKTIIVKWGTFLFDLRLDENNLPKEPLCKDSQVRLPSAHEQERTSSISSLFIRGFIRQDYHHSSSLEKTTQVVATLLTVTFRQELVQVSCPSPCSSVSVQFPLLTETHTHESPAKPWRDNEKILNDHNDHSNSGSRRKDTTTVFPCKRRLFCHSSLRLFMTKLLFIWSRLNSLSQYTVSRQVIKFLEEIAFCKIHSNSRFFCASLDWQISNWSHSLLSLTITCTGQVSSSTIRVTLCPGLAKSGLCVLRIWARQDKFFSSFKVVFVVDSCC